jgi:hypothetical protein
VQWDGTTQVGPFGPVRSVSAFDPRISSNPMCYEVDVTAEGTRVIDLDIGRPWVWSRLVTPVLTGDEFDAAVTYEATDEQDIVYPASTATTAGAPPSSGAQEVYFVTTNPNGVTTATAPAIAYSANGSVWLKTGLGTSSSGWELILGDGT